MKNKFEFYDFLNKHSLLKKICKFIIYNLYPKFTKIFRTMFRTVPMQDWYLAQLNVVKEVHKESFKGYKNKYAGRDIAIIATGNTLKFYQPLENVINIGVNKACLYDKVKLDYFFAIDYNHVKSYLNTLLDYPNKSVVPFLGIHPPQIFGLTEVKSRSIIPESEIIKLNAKKYYLYTNFPPYNCRYNTEIDKTWFVEGGSVVFSAMQFALFTNPKRIYLVGCDCSTGYFDEKKPVIKPNKDLVRSWKELKKFVNIYYPETEIISVNPVGLKGIFKDIYQ